MSFRRCQYCGCKIIDDGANGHVFCSTCIEKTNQRLREMKEERGYNSEILKMLPDLQTLNKMTEKMIKGLEMEEDFKGERMYVAETDGTFDPSDIRPGGARFLLKGPDYKAKYEKLQKAYIKQIDQTQDVIDKYMALADKYSDLVDKHTELKKG